MITFNIIIMFLIQLFHHFNFHLKMLLCYFYFCFIGSNYGYYFRSNFKVIIFILLKTMCFKHFKTVLKSFYFIIVSVILQY